VTLTVRAGLPQSSVGGALRIPGAGRSGGEDRATGQIAAAETAPALRAGARLRGGVLPGGKAFRISRCLQALVRYIREQKQIDVRRTHSGWNNCRHIC